MGRSGEGKLVCVTGASGFIASWIVKLLLERGYSVNASVRDPDDPRKTRHLLALDGAKERLHLFKANLLEDGSFDSAIDGCEGVFHTACPCHYEADDPKVELIDPAVKGTLNVLQSCSKASSIKRVVLTSSIATVLFNGKPLVSEATIDESWYTNLNGLEKSKESGDPMAVTWFWYIIAKTRSEEAAWQFVKKKGIDMVTINPAYVVGTLLGPTLNTTSAVVLNLINGAETYPNAVIGWDHVKDVAMAHIRAFENPSAVGRYCLGHDVKHFSEIVKILEEIDPTHQLPNKPANDKPSVPKYRVSKEKVTKDLGINFVPLEDTLKEAVASLKKI